MTRPNSSHTGKRRKARARGALTPPALAPETREMLEQALGYRFKASELLDRALTHRSAAQGATAEWSNERLEFLGDRVLGLIVAQHLLDRFPTAREGELAPRLNSVVSRETCATVGTQLGIQDCLILDKAERAAGAANRPSLISNAAEAVLGAIYLDGGFAAARQVVATHWKQALRAAEELVRDPKTALQEWAQGDGRPAPAYTHAGRVGPDHAPRFTATVVVVGFDPACGEGASKQEAERAAARALLTQIGARA